MNNIVDFPTTKEEARAYSDGFAFLLFAERQGKKIVRVYLEVVHQQWERGVKSTINVSDVEFLDKLEKPLIPEKIKQKARELLG